MTKLFLLCRRPFEVRQHKQRNNQVVQVLLLKFLVTAIRLSRHELLFFCWQNRRFKVTLGQQGSALGLLRGQNSRNLLFIRQYRHVKIDSCVGSQFFLISLLVRRINAICFVLLLCVLILLYLASSYNHTSSVLILKKRPDVQKPHLPARLQSSKASLSAPHP